MAEDHFAKADNSSRGKRRINSAGAPTITFTALRCFIRGARAGDERVCSLSRERWEMHDRAEYSDEVVGNCVECEGLRGIRWFQFLSSRGTGGLIEYFCVSVSAVCNC